MKTPRGLLLLAVGIVFACIAVLAMAPSAPPARPAAIAVASSLPPPNPAMVKTCKDLLKSMPAGAVRRYEWKDGYGTVVVGPAFYVADFEAKQIVDANLRCLMSEGRADYAGIKYVEYLDWQTNKEVARYSDVTGFAVD